MTQVPVFVVYELEVRQREFIFKQLCQLVLYGLSPLANQHDKLIDGPCDTTARHLRIIALELSIQMFRLS